MLSEAEVHALLEPFGLRLSGEQSAQLLTYLELLTRWNSKINLTSIRTPEKSLLTRHFGESLCLARSVKLHGSLLDVGSGAGFPGLALRILFPDLSTTLLEPVAKKRAFLKEVAHACGMASVKVRGDRLEQFVAEYAGVGFDAVTARAVGQLDRLVPEAAGCLRTGGNLCLWLSLEQVAKAKSASAPVLWSEPVPLPLSRQRVILIGTRR